jgi:hypothetical protein
VWSCHGKMRTCFFVACSACAAYVQRSGLSSARSETIRISTVQSVPTLVVQVAQTGLDVKSNKSRL